MARVQPGAAGTSKAVPVDAAAGAGDEVPAWRRRVVDRTLGKATRRSLDRGAALIFAAATLLERSNGDSFTVQDVADTAKLSLRSLYQHFDGKDDLLLAVLEEAMQTYAQLILEAIEEYENPLDRLAGAVYFAARLSERSTRGISVGLTRLRMTLVEVAPEKLAAAQEPLTALFSRLLREAAEAGEIQVPNPQATVYMLLALHEAFVLSHTLGNEYALQLPSVTDLVEFCFHGLNARLPAAWEEQFAQRLKAIPRRLSVADNFDVTRKTT